MTIPIPAQSLADSGRYPSGPFPMGVGLDPEVVISEDIEQMLERGVESCQRGDWKLGLRDLVKVAENRGVSNLPSTFYSYLGRALAIEERRYQEALRLCRYAVRQEFYQLENYVNLAHSCLLANRRQEASAAVTKGLQIDDSHPELCELQHELGARCLPVLGFLPRRSPVNKILGRVRFGLRRTKPG